jgi:hypothetical protein
MRRRRKMSSEGKSSVPESWDSRANERATPMYEGSPETDAIALAV